MGRYLKYYDFCRSLKNLLGDLGIDLTGEWFNPEPIGGWPNEDL